MQAELNYLPAIATSPHVDLTRSDLGGTLRLERRSVAVAELEVDADPAAALAQRGFAAIPFSGAVELKRAKKVPEAPFAEAVARTVGPLLGARGVLVLRETVILRRGQGRGAQTAIPVCHADFTASSAAARFAALRDTHPLAREAQRFAIYNVWWLASAAPQDVPLALCDASTVAPADLVTGAAVIHDAGGAPLDFGEVAFYRYNPRHRWSWYPGLSSERLLLFAGHDSNPLVASQVPHTAFDNPACPPGTPTRVSVECRCFAFW